MSIIEIRDESRLCGFCDSIISPSSAVEVQAIIQEANNTRTPVTIAGARTGIAGGAVPQGGMVLSTENLTHISSVTNNKITVGSGLTLANLKAALVKEKKLHFAPNPTENTATIGGLFACDGAGGNSRKYGSVSQNTCEIEFVSATGILYHINRGDYRFDSGGCNLPFEGRLDCEVYEKATVTKALTPVEGMDLVDFIAGSEGTLGVITALTLELKPKTEKWGIVYFFSQMGEALAYLNFLHNWDGAQKGVIEECEFFCNKTLALLEKKKSTTQCLQGFPPFPENSTVALLVILSGETQEMLEAVLSEHYESFCAMGGTDSATWGFEGEAEIEKLHILRHAVPEILNAELDLCRQTMSAVTKMGTDFTTDISIEKYQSDIHYFNLDGFIFGHALDGHCHINILVHSLQELSSAKKCIEQWASEVVENGGLLVSENGIGKLKRDLVQSFLTRERSLHMKKVKTFFDPHNLLTQGTILS